MASLKTIIEQNDTPAGRVIDVVIQALILVSLVSFSVETLPDTLQIQTGSCTRPHLRRRNRRSSPRRRTGPPRWPQNRENAIVFSGGGVV